MAGDCDTIGHVWESEGGQWRCSECGQTSYRMVPYGFSTPAMALRAMAYTAGRGPVHDSYEAAADALDRMEDDDVDDA